MGKSTSRMAIRLRPLGLIPVTVFGLLTTLATGGGGGGGGGTTTPPPSPPADEASGGAWVGTDSNGFEVVALSTDDGRLHWVSSTFDQGFGIASVDGSAITMDYTFIPPFGSVLEDGSAYATCTATGTIEERQSMTLTMNCTTELGGMFSDSVSLTYDPLYERDSSLALIAGNYTYNWLPNFGYGFVVNIDGNGVIFAQEPLTGCVINGEASILDSQFNAYDISYTISTCNLAAYPEVTPYNGATFTGLGMLDNTESPEVLIAALKWVDVVARSFSVVIELPRI